MKAWQVTLVPTCWLPHEALEGLRPATAAPPVPLRARVCGDPVTFVGRLTVPDRAPTAEGMNFTPKVQDWPGLKGVPVEQFDGGTIGPKEKSVPVKVNGAVNIRADVPVLVRVTVCAEVVVPGTTTPKLRDVGLMVIAGAPPVPFNGT